MDFSRKEIEDGTTELSKQPNGRFDYCTTSLGADKAHQERLQGCRPIRQIHRGAAGFSSMAGTNMLPIGEYLYIVQKGTDRVIKCNCGQEFGDYHQNWK